MNALRNVVNLVQIVALLAAVATVVGLAIYRGPGAAPPDVALGAHVYDTTCVSCHGPVGEGVVGPPIGGGRTLEIYPERRVMLDLVRDGRAGMPAFSGALTSGEIGAVVDYVRGDLGR